MSGKKIIEGLQEAVEHAHRRPTDDLKARLTVKVRTTPMICHGFINSAGQSGSTIVDDGMRYRNPDGPEALARIEELDGENAQLKNDWADTRRSREFWSHHAAQYKARAEAAEAQLAELNAKPRRFRNLPTRGPWMHDAPYIAADRADIP